jgi:hypothetical protein
MKRTVYKPKPLLRPPVLGKPAARFDILQSLPGEMVSIYAVVPMTVATEMMRMLESE